MRLITTIMALILCAGLTYAQGPGEFKNNMEKVSYAVGMGVGKNLTRQGLEVDPEALLRGLKDVLKGKKTRLSDAEFQQTMRKISTALRARQKERQVNLGTKNKKEGAAFLARNKKRKGVKTLPSGLQYRVLREGNGKKPQLTSSVVTNYRGTLVNGTEFDSSYKRGKPATFTVRGVIAGWTEALQLMPVGSKWKLFVPASLAYGGRGAGGLIGPNSTLIFEIELLAIKKPEKPHE